jgi:hypothetical protein
MQPESMHSIEVVETPRGSEAPGSPSDLRIELKCHP